MSAKSRHLKLPAALSSAMLSAFCIAVMMNVCSFAFAGIPAQFSQKDRGFYELKKPRTAQVHYLRFATQLRSAPAVTGKYFIRNTAR